MKIDQAVVLGGESESEIHFNIFPFLWKKGLFKHKMFVYLSNQSGSSIFSKL